MTRLRKICLIVLAFILGSTGALYFWDAILVAGMRSVEIPYIRPGEDEFIYNADIDPEGKIWLYGNFGIRAYDGNGRIVQEFLPKNTPAIKYAEDHYSVPWINFDRSGRLWIIADDQLYLWEGIDWTVFSNEYLLMQDDVITSLAFDEHGGIWVGKLHHGLVFMDSQSVVAYTRENSGLANNRIEDITIGANGNVWVATWGGGVSIYDGEQWQTINQENSPLLSNYVYSITFDDQSRAWIGAIGGLNIYDEKNWLNYTPDNSGIQASLILGITFDKSGRAWIETYHPFDGFSIFNGNQWLFYIVPNNYWDDDVFYVTSDKTGNLFVIEMTGGLRPFVSSVSKLPDHFRLISRQEVYLNLLISSGGLLLLSMILIMMDLTILFKAWWALGVNIGVAALTLGYGALAAITGMLGGLIGRWLGRSRKAEIIGSIIGLIPGILVSCILLFGWLVYQMGD